MRKKIYALVVVIVTIITLLVVRIPGIDRDKNLGMFYRGGFEVLYEIKPTSDSEMSQKEVAKAAEAGISQRLEIEGIDSIVVRESNSYVRVSVANPSLYEANEIKQIIESSSEITFRSDTDELLATGEELLSENAASVDINNRIVLSIADTDKLEEITEEVIGGRLIIWLGFEEGDSYENIQYSPTTAKKIIYHAEITEALKDETITASGFNSKAAAERSAQLINSGTYNFEMEYHYLRQIDSEDAKDLYNFSMIAIGSAILLAIIILIVIYRGAGALGALSLLFMAAFALSFFNLTNGIYTISSIAGFIVGLVIAIDALIIIYERIKKEIYGGKTPEKAYNDGYKKSIPAIVDSLATTFIVAVVLFFLGNFVLKSFASMLLISLVSLVISILVINHFMLLILLLTPFGNKIKTFGAKEKYIKDTSSGNKQIGMLKIGRKYSYAFMGMIAVALVVALVSKFAFKGNYLNLTNDFKSGTTIIIETEVNYFQEVSDVEAFLAHEDIDVEAENIKIDFNDKTNVYLITIEGDTKLLNSQNEINILLEDELGENTEFDYFYKLQVQGSSNKASSIVVKNALLTGLVSSIIIGFYLLFRYRLGFGLAAMATIVHNTVALISIFAIFRFGVSFTFMPAVIAAITYGINSAVVVFARINEFLKVKRRVYITNEERREAVNNALNSSLSRLVYSAIINSLFLIVIMIFSPLATTLFNLALVLGIGISIMASMLVAPLILLLMEYRRGRKDRTFKPKREPKYFKEKEERTFIGVND